MSEVLPAASTCSSARTSAARSSVSGVRTVMRWRRSASPRDRQARAPRPARRRPGAAIPSSPPRTLVLASSASTTSIGKSSMLGELRALQHAVVVQLEVLGLESLQRAAAGGSQHVDAHDVGAGAEERRRLIGVAGVAGALGGQSAGTAVARAQRPRPTSSPARRATVATGRTEGSRHGALIATPSCAARRAPLSMRHA